MCIIITFNKKKNFTYKLYEYIVKNIYFNYPIQHYGRIKKKNSHV